MTEDLIKRFQLETKHFYHQVKSELEPVLINTNNKFTENEQKQKLKILKKKYAYLKFLRLNKRSKLNVVYKAYIYEILNQPDLTTKFTKDEKEKIIKYYIKKNRGLFKHAQTDKTFYCNLKIMEGFQSPHTFTICIAKNDLEANRQWILRLCKDLEKRNPTNPLHNQILIISSKIDSSLKEKSTHCKTLDQAWSHLKQENEFKVVFVCSNKVRINDILDMSESFLNLKEDLRKNLVIIHDEAHNQKQGVPAYRRIIENIICKPNVDLYMPVTASNETLSDNTNPLWNNKNLEFYAENYTGFDNTKSDSPNYASCKDSIQISFDEMRKSKNWKNYNITQISEDTFNKVYPNENKNKRNLDFDSQRGRGFVSKTKETEAVNNGLNCLKMNDFLDKEYFIPNKFNLSIINTPLRKLITRFIAEEAVKESYNPIVLAIYGDDGSKYNLFYDDKEEEVTHKMGKGQFNDKIYNLIKSLNNDGVNTERPFIIIGNYNPTGESITFPNFEYGTVRGVIRLISTNPAEDYQVACRGNYKHNKFLENNSDFIQPDKYLIGEKQFIHNAISVEEQNDDRIDILASDRNPDNTPSVDTSSFTKVSESSLSGITASPACLIVDRTDTEVQKLVEIANKKRKTKKDKSDFISLLVDCIENPDVDCKLIESDANYNLLEGLKKNGKLNFKINGFRTYLKDSRGDWKFTNYKRHHEAKVPFINMNSKQRKNELDILIPIDRYIVKNTDGSIKEENSKSIWWIGYKY